FEAKLLNNPEKAPMTTAQRRRINRENGRKGGPKTDEGKRRSSRNALKHGLCGVAAGPLPNEDPRLIAHEYARWADCYGPRTGDEDALARATAKPSLPRQRCERHYGAVPPRQVLTARADSDRAHEAEVEGFVARFAAEPAPAVAGLRR